MTDRSGIEAVAAIVAHRFQYTSLPMKSALALSAALLGTTLAAGCATVDDKTAAEVKAPREYRTGSNIPVKDPAPPQTAEERERALEAIRAIQHTGARPPSN